MRKKKRRFDPSGQNAVMKKKGVKRAISILLALVMILALVACTGNPQTSDNSTPSNTQESASAAEKKFTVGFALNDLDEAQSVIYQHLERFCEEKNIELILANAAGSIDQQLTDIENFTTNKVDIIIVSALDSNAVVDVCNAARAAGIYVIDYVMGISSEVDVRFGYNFYDMAATQAQACIKYLNENPDATLKIGYIWGSNSMELCQQLYKGFTETMANSEIKDRYEIVVEGTADWAADKARARAADRTARTGRYSAIARSYSRRWLCSCSLDSYHHSSKRMVFFRLQLRYAALPEIVRGAALLLFRPNSTIMEKTKLLEVWLPWYENSFAC